MIRFSLQAIGTIGILLQIGTKETQGRKSATFHGTRWNRENICGFLNTQFLPEAQAQYLTLFQTQARHGFMQAMVLLPALEPFRWIGFLRTRLRKFGPQINMAHIGTDMVITGQMVRNSIQPGTKRAWIAITLGITDQTNEGFLGQIFGQMYITQDAIEVRNQRRMVTLVNAFQRLYISS